MAVANSKCKQICISDLNKKASVEQRVITAPSFGNSKATETFNVLVNAYFQVQTTRGTQRFSGVNIDERATHLFVTRWNQTIQKLDGAGEYFLRLSDRLYRTIEITNINEQNAYVIFQCTERGLDTKEETNA